MWHLKVCVALLVAVASAESQSRKSTATIDICPELPSQIKCYCKKHTANTNIKSAECYMIPKAVDDDSTLNWEQFKYLNSAISILLGNLSLRDIPTAAFTYLDSLIMLNIESSNITEIQPYAFSNLSRLESLKLSDNQIERLQTHAFTKHERLKNITLDTNNLKEINRNVFVELPSLEKLYLTGNKISTIHDKAFESLIQLHELDIDKNSIFALTNETFYGLTNLLKLELAHNALEVIGDNTFTSLPKLQYLNLLGNRIQMLDSKAFFGLQDLKSLYLSSNKLFSLEHDDLFKSLTSLNSLYLSGNKLQELKPSIFKPILHNLYKEFANFDIEDNNFTCNCNLEWLIQLQNKTKNISLRNKLNELECQPDPETRGLAEAYTNVEDTEIAEHEANKDQVFDYEYDDVSELGGKLFYSDIRKMLNCSHDMKPSAKQESRPKTTTSISPYLTNIKSSSSTEPITPSASVNPQPVDEVFFPADPVSKNDHDNRGVLDLSIIDDTTTNSKETTAATIQPHSKSIKKIINNVDDSGHSSFTKSRVASVTAKPKSIYNKYEENEMASDEAVASKSDRQKPVTEEPILIEIAQHEKKPASSANRRSFGLEICLLIAFIIGNY